MVVGLVLGPLGVAVSQPNAHAVASGISIDRCNKELCLAGTFRGLRATLGPRTKASSDGVPGIALASAFYFHWSCNRRVPRIFGLMDPWQGRHGCSSILFHILLGVVLVNSVWNASSAVPLAGNKHQRLAIVYLVCTSATLLVAYPLIVNFGLKGAGVALISGEILMAIYVVHLSNKLLSDRRSAFAASMVDTTQFRMLLRRLCTPAGMSCHLF